jgi:predicted transcriptional regulator YdeE
MKPEPEEITSEKIITGMSVRTSNDRESDPKTAAIPGLWKRFMAKRAGGANTALLYAVYSDYESDANGQYTVTVGAASTSDEISEARVATAAGDYLVFTSTGEMPKAVIDGWKQVWAYFADGAERQRAYTTDFELHDPKNPSTVRIYIAV